MGSMWIRCLIRWSSENKILDPKPHFLHRWYKIMVLSCVIAVSLDPLFFYIPVIDAKNLCLSVDKKLEIIACILRTLTDLLYVFHIVCTRFITSSSRVIGRSELIKDPKVIAPWYLKPHFIIDVLSVLPLPQAVILIVIPSVNGPESLVTKELLKIVIFCQYVPRLWRIYPLFRKVLRSPGKFTRSAWAGAALNLFLYMLCSHVIGALWYLFSVERKEGCWQIACDDQNYCNRRDLYCDVERRGSTSFLNSSCPLLEPNEIKSPQDFDFGIFLDAHQSHVAEHTQFLRKSIYCFWWGLRNLSSLGQDLKTSNFIGEILFVVFISIMGLILFSLLISNMQKYLQSITAWVEEEARADEMRAKRRDAEQWMSRYRLPENMREKIRRYEKYKWRETKGVEEEALFQSLPKHLRTEIKSYLCLASLKKVPVLGKMDDRLLDALCSRLRPVLYKREGVIACEGDPVDEMLFITKGEMSITINYVTSFLNLEDRDPTPRCFCGEELLPWAIFPNSYSSLPISTRTVQALTDVEVFSLMGEDLKLVISQYRFLLSEQELRKTFRLYSQKWRNWAACYIQAAWRRQKILREAKFAVIANHVARTVRFNHPLIPLVLLLKPAEPDFSASDHSLKETP